MLICHTYYVVGTASFITTHGFWSSKSTALRVGSRGCGWIMYSASDVQNISTNFDGNFFLYVYIIKRNAKNHDAPKQNQNARLSKMFWLVRTLVQRGN